MHLMVRAHSAPDLAPTLLLLLSAHASVCFFSAALVVSAAGHVNASIFLLKKDLILAWICNLDIAVYMQGCGYVYTEVCARDCVIIY